MKKCFWGKVVPGVLFAMLIVSGCEGTQNNVEETTTIEEESTYMTTEGFYKLSEVTEDYSFKKKEDKDKGIYKA